MQVTGADLLARILARGHREGRVLVTLDKDFGELAVVQKRPHSGIIPLVGFAARKQAAILNGSEVGREAIALSTQRSG